MFPASEQDQKSDWYIENQSNAFYMARIEHDFIT